MNKSKIIATLIVATLLGITMIGLRHIKNLDTQIQLKQIDLKDNSARLKLLDSKYIELNKELEAKDVDKAKVEEQLKQLQIERDKLQADLQAKKEQKAKDLAVRASQAVGAPQTAQASGSGDCASEITKYDWNQTVALAVARAESGLRTNALNDNPRTGDYSVGCFQINIIGANARNRPSEAELKNANINVAFAHKIYVANGRSWIGQWGVCRSMVSCY